MNPERWKRVEALLDAALDLDAGERASFLARECSDDPSLVKEVLSILHAGETGGSILERRAVDVAGPMVETTIQPPIPVRVGAYRIDRVIGEGGMGTVYLAHRDDGEFDQRVALKVVRYGLHEDERMVRRFREERQILATLSHPGIARILDGGITEDGLPYFAMDFVDGAPIDRYCAARNSTIEERLDLFGRVCDAVAHAHGKQVVHRDIKPSNILVTDAGEPRLLDFGIAKLLDSAGATTDLTRKSERLLTPEYASPEQIRGEPVVVASDVYCLGVLLYELLTGQRPFKRVSRSVVEFERAVLEEDPTMPSNVVRRDPRHARLKGDLDAIVLKAMQKLPEHRYPSAAELGADVRRHLAGQVVTARHATSVYRLRQWARRQRVLLWSAVAGVAAGIALMLGIASRTKEGSGDTVLRGARMSSPRHFTDDEGLELDPAISPDGKQVAYAAGQGNAMRIFVRRLDDPQPVMLTASIVGDHRRPRWSPDGSRLLFQAQRAIWMVPASGGPPSQVVAAPSDTTSEGAHSATWSPDGNAIAWVALDTVFTRALRGDEKPRALATMRVVHSLAWSPDGRWIAAVSGNAEFVYWSLGNTGPSAIYLIPVRCERAMCAPALLAPPTSLNTSPEWLDAARLVFISNRDGARDLFGVRIHPDGTADGAPVPLSVGQQMHTVSVARDGRTLAYSEFRQSTNIWSLDISSNRPRRLADATRITSGRQTIEGMDLSRDGTRLVFDANRTGQQDIYVVSSAGGEAERVVGTPTDDFHPTWSPDGKTIAFYTFLDGVRRAATAPATGGAIRLLHPNGPPREEHSPVWTADGLGLVYYRTTGTDKQVYIVRRTNDTTWSDERPLTRRGGSWVSFSADGRRMAYFVGPDVVRVMGPDLDEASSTLVYASAAVGGETPRVTSGVIARDGASFIAKGEDRVSPGFWRIPVGGGTPQLIFCLNDRWRTSPRPEFTTDGRRLFFMLTERESDIWTVRLEDRQ
jgi:Tol biopolymer transport system component